MNLVDSSGWLEYLADGANGKHFAGPLKNGAQLIVPAIVVYEVFKVVLREKGEETALQAAAAMQKGNIVELTLPLAMNAARLSLQHKLPMADSMIFAIAQSQNAVLWTLDSHFRSLPNVRYFSGD